MDAMIVECMCQSEHNDAQREMRIAVTVCHVTLPEAHADISEDNWQITDNNRRLYTREQAQVPVRRIFTGIQTVSYTMPFHSQKVNKETPGAVVYQIFGLKAWERYVQVMSNVLGNRN
ncbi:MAG: hypothetical protein ACLT1C_07455 [Weissella confusa]